MDLSNFVYWEQIDRNFFLLLTQSDPDSQTDPHQAHKAWRSCNAARTYGRHTGSVSGTASISYPLPWFPLSDGLNQCSCWIKPDCRPYRSSLLGYRFGRSGSSGSVVYFRRLRWWGFDRRSRVRAYRSCPKPGSEVSYGLRFAITYLQSISC